MRTSIIAIILTAILTGGCASVLTLESQNCSPVIDGKADDWTGMDFTGFENTGIYSASFNDDSTVYLCMKLLKRDDIMKVMTGSTELSYNNSIVSNTCILMPSHMQNTQPTPEHMHDRMDGPPEGESFRFTVINTDALRRDVDAYFSFNEGIGIIEMGIPVGLSDKPLIMTMLLSGMDKKANRPQNGQAPEAMGGKTPPPGGGMNKPMGNGNHESHNDNEMISDKEITIKIVKSDTLQQQ